MGAPPAALSAGARPEVVAAARAAQAERPERAACPEGAEMVEREAGGGGGWRRRRRRSLGRGSRRRLQLRDRRASDQVPLTMLAAIALVMARRRTKR